MHAEVSSVRVASGEKSLCGAGERFEGGTTRRASSGQAASCQLPRLSGDFCGTATAARPPGRTAAAGDQMHRTCVPRRLRRPRRPRRPRGRNPASRGNCARAGWSSPTSVERQHARQLERTGSGGSRLRPFTPGGTSRCRQDSAGSVAGRPHAGHGPMGALGNEVGWLPDVSPRAPVSRVRKGATAFASLQKPSSASSWRNPEAGRRRRSCNFRPYPIYGSSVVHVASTRLTSVVAGLPLSCMGSVERLGMNGPRRAVTKRSGLAPRTRSC